MGAPCMCHRRGGGGMRSFLIAALAVTAAATAPAPRTRLRRVHWHELAGTAVLNASTAWLIHGVTDGWALPQLLTRVGLLNRVLGAEAVSRAPGIGTPGAPEPIAGDTGHPLHIVDVYPDGMTHAGVHPHLTPAAQALVSMEYAAAAPPPAPPYAQWRLPLATATALLRAATPFPAFAHPHMLLSACWPDPAARNNVMSVIAWWMLVVGVADSGMFGHSDNYDTGTWQIQLLGSKRWALCDPAKLAPGESLGAPGAVDIFAPPSTWPATFPRDLCLTVEAEEGDMVVYPSLWWHQTR